MTAEANVYRSSLRVTAIALAAVAVVGAVTGWLVAEATGLVAALAGVAVAALWAMATQFSMLIGHRGSVNTLVTWVLGSWLVKMVIIIAALVVLAGIENFHRPLFVIFLAAGVIPSLIIDVQALRRSRVPYVDPGSNRASE
jgi:hypothetical protein